MELDPNVFRKVAKNAAVSFSGIIVPFGLGVALSVYMYDKLIPPGFTSFSSFCLFIGVAMSITAFPVLARILTEKRLLATHIGSLTISCAAIDDVTAWILLAVVITIVRASSMLAVLGTALAAIGFVVVLLWPIRLLFRKKRHHFLLHNHLNIRAFLVTFLMLFVCAWFTESIGIHAIFGGFVLGLSIPREDNIAAKLSEKYEDLVVTFFLPLYFTYSGLKTNIDSINSPVAAGITILVILTACAGKIIGCTMAAKWTGETWRDSITLGVLMNTKGLVELIVLNIGLDNHVLTTQIFSIMVVMCLVTTMMTSPLIDVLTRGEVKAAKMHRNDDLLNPDIHDSVPELKISREEDKHNESSVLMCVPWKISGTGLVSIADLLLGEFLRKKKGGGRLLALRVISLSDRPSTWMGPPQHLDDPILSAVKERARFLGIDKRFELMQVVAPDFAVDVAQAAANNAAKVILIAWKSPSGSPSEVEFGLPVVTELFRRSPSSVAVLVDRETFNSPHLTHIVFLYQGMSCDRYALSLIAPAARNPAVHLCVFVAAEGTMGEHIEDAEIQRLLPKKKRGHVKIVRADALLPLADSFLLYLNSHVFDIVVVAKDMELTPDPSTLSNTSRLGSARGSSRPLQFTTDEAPHVGILAHPVKTAIVDQIIQSSKTSVLILHPKRTDPDENIPLIPRDISMDFLGPSVVVRSPSMGEISSTGSLGAGGGGENGAGVGQEKEEEFRVPMSNLRSSNTPTLL
eukprot:CAMPEP_0184660506 /NCGR_PEP_ID=MMETSP0308-20130426/34233_1 /TAXON_ID=38269 /ORGANISM="Gloeochaete witrockiana, Strain SAG 46.84" /LENGTH=743 /DNA_ID=CAMNT_0027101155 /DNA_START=346 /DNA_END=2577 /DNA_ORIENTATION=+